MAVDYLSALNTKGSGLNITQIVDSLVDADVMPKKDALEKQITEKNTQISALAEVVSDLNKLVKMHRQMADVMKKMGRKGNKGLFRSLIGDLTGSGENKKNLSNLMSQNPEIGRNLQPNLDTKNLAKMMGSIPDFMKKN